MTCSPQRSTSCGGTTTTSTPSARSSTSSYAASRARSVSSLESASPGTSPRRPAGRTTAATTSGPAQAPRPASSVPATCGKPLRCRTRSNAHSPFSVRTTGRGATAITRRAPGPARWRRSSGKTRSSVARQLGARPPAVAGDAGDLERREARGVDLVGVDPGQEVHLGLPVVGAGEREARDPLVHHLARASSAARRSPVSSNSSRRAASTGDSPSSSPPPGVNHQSPRPASAGSVPRSSRTRSAASTSSTRAARRSTTAAASGAVLGHAGQPRRPGRARPRHVPVVVRLVDPLAGRAGAAAGRAASAGRSARRARRPPRGVHQRWPRMRALLDVGERARRPLRRAGQPGDARLVVGEVALAAAR